MPTSTGRVGFGVGAMAVAGGVAVLVFQCRARQASQDQQTSRDGAPTGLEVPKASNIGTEDQVEDVDGPNVKSRVHGFKISKLSRLVDGIAQELGQDHRIDTATGEVVNASGAAASSVSTTIREVEPESVQFDREHRTLDEAIRIVQLIRKSGLPKKLPHFQVTNRHLEDAENLLGEIADNVEEFWRYSRDEPMADLLDLPLLRFAAENIATGGVALVPKLSASSDEILLEQDCALLGVETSVDKDAVLSAFRRKALELHQKGHCTDVDVFHKLNNACQRRVAHGRFLPHVAFKGKCDDLAVHLLVGADPRDSRYRDPSAAIMDAVHREKLLQRIHVVRNWGEVGGSITGLGQG